MVKFIFMILILNGFFLFHNFCVNKGSSFNDYQIKADTIIKDVPLSNDSVKYRKIRRQFEERLGLSSLENGVNGTEIRISLSNALSDQIQMIRICDSNSRWSAYLYTILFRMNEKNDSLISLKKYLQKKEPKSGWKYFIDTLFSLEIETLPDFTLIKGYARGLPMDASSVIVEFANKKKYRLYVYPAYKKFAKEYWQAKNMKTIMDLMEEELGFNWN